jgi:serine/threonine-protein kinase
MSWRTGTRRLFPYLLIAAAGFVAAYLVVYFFVFPSALVPDDVRAPNVVGSAYETAATRLAAAGFTAREGSRNFHATAPAGTVLRQNPEPGAMRPKGTAVTLDLSAGQRTAEVPGVVGAIVQRAEVAIQNTGLEVGELRLQKADAARGVVLAVEPAAGTAVQLPAKVVLTVSDGPATVRVPDLVGRTVAGARAAVRDAGLRFLDPPAQDTLSLGAPGSVVRQSPAPGAAVPPGTGVRVTVTVSPPNPMAVPPAPAEPPAGSSGTTPR